MRNKIKPMDFIAILLLMAATLTWIRWFFSVYRRKPFKFDALSLRSLSRKMMSE